MARAPENTTFAMKVLFADHADNRAVDRVVRFPRGDGAIAVVEADVPHGEYRVVLNVPAYTCSATDVVEVFGDHSRTIDETLAEAPEPPASVVLMFGSAPLSFLYVKPTFVVYDKSVTCDGPIASMPVPSRVVATYDQGAYYVSLFGDPAPTGAGPWTVAMRLRTPTGLAHYIRLPTPFPPQLSPWPSTVRFDISEDMIDGIATEPTDKLLCPKIWETVVH